LQGALPAIFLGHDFGSPWSEQQPLQESGRESGRQKDDDPHECGMPYCHGAHH
jgi:hypothetical protein